MSVIGDRGTNMGDRGTNLGRSRARSPESIAHGVAARRGQAEKLEDLRKEARETGIPFWYRMKVGKLEELKGKNWEITEEDIAEFVSS